MPVRGIVGTAGDPVFQCLDLGRGQGWAAFGGGHAFIDIMTRDACDHAAFTASGDDGVLLFRNHE